jgi:hypothetical protein
VWLVSSTMILKGEKQCCLNWWELLKVNEKRHLWSLKCFRTWFNIAFYHRWS